MCNVGNRWNMKAVILNSGIGSRLGRYTKNNPKCMVEIQDNVTILKRQLKLLKKSGVEEIIITTGYMSDKIKDHLKGEWPDIEYVFNDKYESTNYIKSLDNVKAEDDDIILMHGDLVFEYSVLMDMVSAENSCMVIDKSLGLPEKDFKAVVEENKIKAVGVEYFDNAFSAQPLYKLKNKDWNDWKKAIRQYCLDGKTNVYAENALNTITDVISLFPLDINGRLCSEIDNEEDLIKIRLLLNNKI